jgi:phage tail sheath protein FI
MDEQTPNTKPSALDKINALRLANKIKDDLDKIKAFTTDDGFAPNDGYTRDVLKQSISQYLEDIRTRGAVQGFEVGTMRRQLWRDVYPAREDRTVALRVWWRKRTTNEKLVWYDGEEPTFEQQVEFGRLIHSVYYEDDQGVERFAYKHLRRPAGYITDILITPVQPVKFITVNMEITDGEVQLS